MKRFYLVLQICQNGKWYAHAWPVTDSDNLLSVIERMGPGVVSVNIAPTKKRAGEIVNAWRDGYREQGIYYWDTMPDGSPAPF
jgi:hypothetical protein